METSKHRLRRAMRLPGPSIGLRRSQTDTTNDQAQPGPGDQAEGGVEVAATGLPHRRSIPPSLASRGGQATMSPDNSNSLDRWAEIKRKAEIRRKTDQGTEQSDEETQNEETIESRVSRIKARVAELTSNAKGERPVYTESKEGRPLTLQARRHTTEVIASSPISQRVPRRNASNMEAADTKDALSESRINDTVLASTRTSSADGSEPTRTEQDPFCKPWYSGSILDQILSEMGVESVRSDFVNLGVTDLWLPLSKQLLRRFLTDPHHGSKFLALQDEHLKVCFARWTQPVSGDHIPDMLFRHCEFEDDEEIFEEKRLLGEGMVGTVEEVTVRSREPPIVCVRKKIARPKQLKGHQQIMAAFIREVRVMRQVDHRHCVCFIGSYTDHESVNILSMPVADMDLAAFLDEPIGDREWAILYKGIDCLCNGLLYLHEKKIRHEDLKPQNVLVHGENILLTDFGFSLDFSDDSVSTTTGRPSAWTIRYSAPEVLDSEPRNRASDIFSLGCVLIEMVSGLYGHSLSEVKDHWKRTSNKQSSFARNSEATSSWLALLSDHPASSRLKPIVDFLPALLVTKRLDRPSAQVVVARMHNLSLLLPDPPHLVNTCCGPPPGWIDNLHPERIEGSGLPKTRDAQLWSDIRSYFNAVADSTMTYVVLDQNYNQVAAKHDCYYYFQQDIKRGTTRVPYILDLSGITDACAMLFLMSTKTRQMLDQTQSQPGPLTMLDYDHLLPEILEKYTSWEVIFTVLRAKVRIPVARADSTVQVPSTRRSTAWHKRTIQISMVGHGHCPDDERYFSSVFYVLAFKISEEGYEPSKLGAPFVDLTLTSD